MQCYQYYLPISITTFKKNKLLWNSHFNLKFELCINSRLENADKINYHESHNIIKHKITQVLLEVKLSSVFEDARILACSVLSTF